MYKKTFLLTTFSLYSFAKPNRTQDALNQEVNRWIKDNSKIFRIEVQGSKHPLYKTFCLVCKDHLENKSDNNKFSHCI
ncbi:hypothetical protein [Holospora curviuscula]|nr:hypothetical protein [Holospora curviuscula]